MAYTWSLALVLLSACSSKEPTAAPPPPSPRPTVEVRPKVGLEVHRFDAPPVVLPLRKEFTLLDPGKGPTRKLRYTRRAETVSYTSETTLTSKKLQGGTWAPGQPMPVIKNGLAVTSTSDQALVAARILPGEIVGSASADATQYLAASNALQGRRLKIEVDARGQLGAVTFADDPDTTRSATERDEIVQRLLATLVPLPEEPVGVGAKWRVVTALRQRPAIVKQTATYTLEAMTADAWQIGVDIQRIGEPQLLIEPDLPKDVAVELVALVRLLKGTLSIDPRAMLGTGSFEVSSTIHIRAAAPKRGSTEEIIEDVGSIKLAVER